MTPDAWMFVALFLVGLLFFVGYHTGSLAVERREHQRLRRELARRKHRECAGLRVPRTGARTPRV